VTSIDNITIRQARELASMFTTPIEVQPASSGISTMIGQKAIVRTYSAGVWFGVIQEKSGGEVIVSNARRLWFWKAAKSISLSAVALYGVDTDKSKITPPVNAVWLEAIEIIPCTDTAIASIEGARHAEAE